MFLCNSMMDSQCDAKDMLNTQLTTINPEATCDSYQYQQNVPKRFQEYQLDDTTVKEKLALSKMAIGMNGNTSRVSGNQHMSYAEECTHFQYDFNSEHTKIKLEPLSDQSHPCISALHDKASDVTLFETEATVCKPTHAGERPHGYQQDDTTVKQELSVSKSAIDIHGNDSHTPGDPHMSNAEEYTQLQYDLNSEHTKIKPEPLSDQSHPCISAFHDKASDGTAFETEASMCKPIVTTNHDNLFVAENIQRPQSEELHSHHKSCSILIAFKEEYLDNMPVLKQELKQENENVTHALVTHHESKFTSMNFDVKPPISSDDMANVSTEISATVLDPHQIKIENNDPQVLIMNNQSITNITTCVDEKPHSCQRCDKSFSSAERLEVHMMTHAGENPYSCSQCEKEYTHTADIKKNRVIHTGEMPHACSQCEKVFAQTSYLKLHMMIHTGERPHSCLQCNKTYTRAGDLTRHMMTHTGKQKYSCLQCEKIFFRKSHLKQHMIIHTDEKPHSCPQCNKCFSRASNLQTHLLIHTGVKSHSCSQCDKYFTQACSLKVHMMTHTGERPHSCSQCNKCFIRATHLQKHMMTHTGERPHSCSQCDKCFTTASHLKQHLMIHTGNKPHSCPQCDKCFTYAGTLKSHMMIHTRETTFMSSM